MRDSRSSLEMVWCSASPMNKLTPFKAWTTTLVGPKSRQQGQHLSASPPVRVCPQVSNTSTLHDRPIFRVTRGCFCAPRAPAAMSVAPCGLFDSTSRWWPFSPCLSRSSLPPLRHAGFRAGCKLSWSEPPRWPPQRVRKRQVRSVATFSACQTDCSSR